MIDLISESSKARSLAVNKVVFVVTRLPELHVSCFDHLLLVQEVDLAYATVLSFKSDREALS